MMKEETAIEIAEAYITGAGYAHGPRICTELTKGNWRIEFAYEGLTERSPTTDPPSILLEVDRQTKLAKLVSLM